MATTRTIANAWINRTLPDIFYEEPEPVEDAVVQERAVHRIIHLLWELFEGRDDVFITGAFYICYDETDGNRRVQPDCFITFDVDAEAVRLNLPNYWVWEVGKVPDLVIEAASPSTKDNDLGPKRELYRWLGIAEYWRLDPTGGELYGQPVTGERLVEGRYEPFELEYGADGSVRGFSRLLGVAFSWDGLDFDVLDPATGRTIDKRTAAETGRAAAEAELRLERQAHANAETGRAVAEARAAAAEAELARLRAQLRQEP